MEQRNDKYKIVVLSDLKDSTENIIKSTIGLANIIGADIKFFHVKKPTEVVERDSQLSTFRTINEQHSLTKNSIARLIDSVSSTYNVSIDYTYAFGNIKNEIKDYLEKHQPDIVVLGKRKTTLGLPVDGITKFVLRHFKGSIMVVGNQSAIEPGHVLSVGFLNDDGKTDNDQLVFSLVQHSEKPIKAFRILDKTEKGEVAQTDADDTIQYVFERNDNTMRSLSKYLTKSKVNLLYLNRKNKINTQGGLRKSDLKDILGKVNVSMLISGQVNSLNQPT